MVHIKELLMLIGKSRPGSGGSRFPLTVWFITICPTPCMPEIHEDIVVKLGENVPSYSVEKKGAAEFKRRRNSLEDDSRQRRPVTVPRQETISTNHDILMTDRRVTEHYIVAELGIFHVRIHAVIHNELRNNQRVSTLCPKPPWT